MGLSLIRDDGIGGQPGEANPHPGEILDVIEGRTGGVLSGQRLTHRPDCVKTFFPRQGNAVEATTARAWRKDRQTTSFLAQSEQKIFSGLAASICGSQ
ncbi:hypothetical protein [Rhodoglobus aureus]|uniref:Uncharacterized protein n=1 Tax=Rhodoglobus aureus TaxID=191497 RepID=A0ABN1VGD9_9MICO